MKYFFYFLIGLLSTHAMQVSKSNPVTPESRNFKYNIPVDSTTAQAIQYEIPLDVTVIDPDGEPTPSEIVKYLLDLLGGILATLILAFLHKKFPKIFTSKNPRDYINRN